MLGCGVWRAFVIRRDCRWGAVGATVAGELVALGHLSLEVEFGLIIPLVADRFYIREGEDLLHQVPDYGWTGGVSLAALP